MAKAVCVFVHGRGQSPEEMQAQVISHLPQGFAYLLPRAEGGVWYKARAVDALTDATRAELTQALDQVEAVIHGASQVTEAPILLAGFSQGACLSLELASRGADIAAMAALTGCRVGLASDPRPQALRRGMPVYLTGGDADPWIPLSAFAEAAADMGAQGAALRADIFPGRKHEVSPAECAMLAAILTDLAQGRAPVMEAPR